MFRPADAPEAGPASSIEFDEGVLRWGHGLHCMPKYLLQHITKIRNLSMGHIRKIMAALKFVSRPTPN